MIEHSSSPTPITILTGFLGAGKTTLLNRILGGTHGLRVAVLVNDFGAINIDAQLVVGVAEDTVSLRNGCICCTIRDDLLRAVLDLLRRAAPPEYLIIECSGISDPVAVAQTFLLPHLRPFVRLDAIIALVDAAQARDHDEYADLIADQIAAADIVVINKADLASANLRAGLRAWVQTIVPQARILEATHADVPLELLLDRRPTTDDRRPTTDDQSPVSGLQSLVSSPHFPLPTSHFPTQHTFETWSYESARPFAFRTLQAALDTLPTTIYRAKGVLHVAEAGGRRVVLQLVGRRVALTPGAAWGDEAPRSQLVVVGGAGGVDAEALQRRLDGCLQ